MKKAKAGVKRFLLQQKARAKDQDNAAQLSPGKRFPSGIKELYAPEDGTVEYVPI